MENCVIWVINIDAANSSVEIELFSGQNKYTKAGLFSGPLRRQELSGFSMDESLRFLLSLSNTTQVGKSKLVLQNADALMLFSYLEACSFDAAYCRLADKKLHHINSFTSCESTGKGKEFVFDTYKGVLTYAGVDSSAQCEERIVTTPHAKLYLYPEGKAVRGYLTFSYQGTEIQANSSQETIALPEMVLLRNLYYEKGVEKMLYSLGGRQSYRNEILFPQKTFFTSILPCLCREDIKLYWGKDRRAVSKAAISCRISYDMDWFSVSGEISGENGIYALSEFLRASKGKSYVEIDNEILFLPEELRKIALFPTEKNEIRLSATHLTELNDIAERFEIDPSDYLNKFSTLSLRSFSIETDINATLRPYQTEGTTWIFNLYKNGFGGCLADDMGLGKTIQTIAFICCNERNTSLPVLVVVPKIVLFNWQNELWHFAPKVDAIAVYGDFDYFAIKEKNAVYLTTYDTLLNHNEAFASIHFDALILDESQYVKNFRTKRYRAVKNIRTNFTLALTGTPIENSIDELWALFELINPGLLGSQATFMRKYGDAHTDENQRERLRKIISPFLLRRTKAQVLGDLPPKEEQYIYCEMDTGQRALYDSLLTATKKELQAKPSRFEIKDNAAILQALLYLRETCSEPQLLPPGLRDGMSTESCKFELFKEYSRRVMDVVGKVIVYSLFPSVLKKLEEWCIRQGWKTFYIDGSVSQRQRIVDEFESSDSGVFLISLKAGGVGLNLVSCQYVFIYDPWWNSAAEQQAANRVYRIGQDKPVFIYHFIVKDTVEEKIYELQQKKESLSMGVLENMNSPEKLSMEDIYNLLQ